MSRTPPPEAIVCIDVVPEILGIAWIVKSASGNGGVGRAVGLRDICLRTVGERHERHLWPGAVACIDVVCETRVTQHSMESQVCLKERGLRSSGWAGRDMSQNLW